MHHEAGALYLLAVLEVRIGVRGIVIGVHRGALDFAGLLVLHVAVEAGVGVLLLHGRAHPEVHDVQRIRQGHQARAHRLVFDEEAGRAFRRGPAGEVHVGDGVLGLLPFAEVLVVGILRVLLEVVRVEMLDFKLLHLGVAALDRKEGQGDRDYAQYLFHLSRVINC